MAEVQTAPAEAATVAPHRRAGRRPKSSNPDKVRDAVIAWKLTPENIREPKTQRELALKLGVARGTVGYYFQSAPDSIGAFIEQAEREALAHYPAVLKVVGDMAEGGSIEAIRAYHKMVVEPARPQAGMGDGLKADIRLQQAIQILLPPPRASNGASVAPSAAIETETVEASPEPAAVESDSSDAQSGPRYWSVRHGAACDCVYCRLERTTAAKTR